MKLSILICSIDSRKEMRADLLRLLLNTMGDHYVESIIDRDYVLDRYIGKAVEVILCTDNKQMTVGAKRNLLIKEAAGEYVAFIDDDDMVMVNYIEALLDATKHKADVIVFDAFRYENGEEDRRVSYGKEYGRDYSNQKVHYRLPNHLMCFKREIAAKARFPEINFGEDSEFARRALPMLKTQHRIYETLYEYWFDKSTTETQKR